MDQLTRTVRIQILVFTAIALLAVSAVGLGYVRLPQMLFGIGQYTVTLRLSESGNLYPTANVTYRGTEVGRVESVDLTGDGVAARLTLRSDVRIPSDLDAEVHSQTAVGEQYVALLPRDGNSRPLRDGDVIPVERTSVPPNLNQLLDATNKGLRAIPNDGVRTVIDEGYTAVGGLGPEFSRFVQGATQLAIDARKHTGDLTSLITKAPEVLDSQADTAGAIGAWSKHLAVITEQVKDRDSALTGILRNGPGAADEARRLIQRINPTLPVVLANLVAIGETAVVYQPHIEQLLVLLPQGVAAIQGSMVANLHQKMKYKGFFLSFNLNLNLPPPCTTGFLPASQRRSPTAVDAPDRPEGDLYCRRPQDSPWNVRGARNIPCATKPWKRAPTVKMCESDEEYVPLNEGMSWKGDPNATLSGQDVPQLPPAAPQPAGAPAVPEIAAAEYDPATGTYTGPDGKTYTQANLATTAAQDRNWQSMLIPPGTN
ncbi:MCE family protein [Mycolicibacterium phlei]|uniref:MCE family protein n=1 Tax=Mycolicibacterium phlei TaxID=1771 RepID=UPI00025ADD58|nr:MlaD family protein [Mycolicibacterium phlei]EID17437.1 virulence factor Mce family protein [Mycolicibacterium phlei RIVM601174]MBF4191059.1 virulence factor Mce family protein [Mycolicibacterium phlei]